MQLLSNETKLSVKPKTPQVSVFKHASPNPESLFSDPTTAFFFLICKPQVVCRVGPLATPEFNEKVWNNYCASAAIATLIIILIEKQLLCQCSYCNADYYFNWESPAACSMHIKFFQLQLKSQFSKRELVSSLSPSLYAPLTVSKTPPVEIDGNFVSWSLWRQRICFIFLDWKRQLEGK
jgi:hypothetical protein